MADFLESTLVFDLHTHSNFSDGTLSPADLISRAVEKGVDVLAITDHDTIAACEQVAAAGQNIELIPGIEFSTQWENTGIHLLGLNFDVNSPAMQQAAASQTEARHRRAKQIALNLEKLGISDAFAGACSFAQGGYLGRPHFAQHIVAIGKAKNMQAAFKKYLAAGQPGDVRTTWAEPPQVIEWILAAGGIPVLAHPLKYSFTASKLKRLLTAFKQLGGQGLEVVSGQQTPEQTRHIGAMCSELNLLASCGSDFHSPETHWAELGRFTPLPAGLKPVWDSF